MKRDGLPWFYFTPCNDKLVPELHERYLREAQALWEGPEAAEPAEPANESLRSAAPRVADQDDVVRPEEP
ncbi:MAG: hypothetical protein MI919_25715 [Holophagales bacterium]|nr:hypothetical protein [Holophagales bacterium]